MNDFKTIVRIDQHTGDAVLVYLDQTEVPGTTTVWDQFSGHGAAGPKWLASNLPSDEPTTLALLRRYESGYPVTRLFRSRQTHVVWYKEKYS